MIRCSDCGNKLDWFFVCTGCGLDENRTDTEVVQGLKAVTMNMVREAQDFAHENGMDQYDAEVLLTLIRNSMVQSLGESIGELADGYLRDLEPIDPESQLAPVPPGLREEFMREHAMSAGMPTNPNGHRYGCECPECVEYYRSLK